MNINAIKLTQVFEHLWQNHQLLKKEIAEKIGLDSQRVSNALRSTNLKTPITVINQIYTAFPDEMKGFEYTSDAVSGSVTQKQIVKGIDFNKMENERLKSENQLLREEIAVLRAQHDKMLDKILKL